MAKNESLTKCLDFRVAPNEQIGQMANTGIENRAKIHINLLQALSLCVSINCQDFMAVGC